MSVPEEYAILFEPVRLGPVEMTNRFYQTPHCLGAGSDRPEFQAHFRATKADGGWGAVFVEYCSIHPETDGAQLIGARLWDEGDVKNLSLTCDMLHERDCLAGVELWYGGAYAPNMEARNVAGAPTQIASQWNPLSVPKKFTRAELRALPAMYAAAAERAAEAGFDIVSVYGAHDQGPMQLLSPHYNRRDDEYGGTFANRARLWLDCIGAVRAAVGEHVAVTSRISLDGLGVAGVSLDDALAFVSAADDLVDYWDVNISGIDWTADIGSSRFFTINSQADWHRKVKAATQKPVVGVGRFTDPAVMVEVIRSGQLDIIGAARPSIADPYLPQKIASGRADDIRECIGCNICVSRWQIGGPPLICTQNPTAGEEYRRGWHPESVPMARNAENDVLIIGAGAAGLECALTLGRRGMRRVHLVDERDDIGGYVGWVSTLPRLSEWRRVVDYRRRQIEKLDNVEIITGKHLNARDALDYGAEIVIVATGAHWSTDGLSGTTRSPVPGADAALAHIATPEQIVLDGKETGDRVVVYDCESYFMAPAIAERLAREGKDVTIITPFSDLAPFHMYTGESGPLHAAMVELGIEVVTHRTIATIEPGAVSAVHHYTGNVTRLEADSVVLVTQRISNEQLFNEIEALSESEHVTEIEGVYRIGDCVAPRLIADCVFDGHRLAREIDSEHPAQPLPFMRERPVIESAVR